MTKPRTLKQMAAALDAAHGRFVAAHAEYINAAHAEAVIIDAINFPTAARPSLKPRATSYSPDTRDHDEAEMIHERAHAGVSDPDGCERRPGVCPMIPAAAAVPACERCSEPASDDVSTPDEPLCCECSALRTLCLHCGVEIDSESLLCDSCAGTPAGRDILSRA